MGYTALSKGDYAKLYSDHDGWHTLVENHHFAYNPTPVMPVENLVWRSQIAILEEYGFKFRLHSDSYYMKTEREVFSKSERSTWINSNWKGYPAIPAQFEFTFDTPKNNPGISVDISVLDDWWAEMCSIRKLTKTCSTKEPEPATANENCGGIANSFCDYGVGYCFCEAGFEADGNQCHECSKDSKPAAGKYTTSTQVDLDDKGILKWTTGTDTVNVEDIKAVIKSSISNPKLYSGPSSAAVALSDASNVGLQAAFKTLKFESAWRTDQLKTNLKSSIALADGGGVDNCGLIGLVRQYQSKVVTNDMDVWTVAKNIDETVLGMCALNDMSLLVTNMNYDGTMNSNERSKVYYPIFTLDEAPTLQFTGDVLEVWSTRVTTLYEPINGILPGSSFTVFLFFFPQDKPRETKGLCRNMGLASVGKDAYGNCAYNMVNGKAKDPNDQNPLLSLLLGRGETFELQISLTAAAEDMQKLADKLGFQPKESESVRVAAPANVLTRLDNRILAFGGVFVSVAFLFYLRAKMQAQEDSVYSPLMNSTEDEI